MIQPGVVAAAACACALLAACTGSAGGRQGAARPSATATSSTTTTPAAPTTLEPARLPEAADPGFILLTRNGGTANSTLPIQATSEGAVQVLYSCAGPDRIEVRLGGQGAGALCDGSAQSAEFPVSRGLTSLQVEAAAGATWNVLVQQRG